MKTMTLAEIAELLGVVAHRVELLPGPHGPGVVKLSARQSVPSRQALDLLADVRGVRVGAGLVVREVRHVGPHVEVVVAPDGAGQVVGLVVADRQRDVHLVRPRLALDDLFDHLEAAAVGDIDADGFLLQLEWDIFGNTP